MLQGGKYDVMSLPFKGLSLHCQQVFLFGTKVFSAVYTIKEGSTFRIEPNGEIMTIYPGMIETPPLERQNEWCFFNCMMGGVMQLILQRDGQNAII